MAGGEGLQIACVKLKLCADNSTERFRGVGAFGGPLFAIGQFIAAKFTHAYL